VALWDVQDLTSFEDDPLPSRLIQKREFIKIWIFHIDLHEKGRRFLQVEQRRGEGSQESHLRDIEVRLMRMRIELAGILLLFNMTHITEKNKTQDFS